MFEEGFMSFFTRSFPCFPFSTQGGNTWATKCQYLGCFPQFFGAEDDQPEIQWINTAEARATTAPASPRSTKVQHAGWLCMEEVVIITFTHNLPTSYPHLDHFRGHENWGGHITKQQFIGDLLDIIGYDWNTWGIFAVYLCIVQWISTSLPCVTCQSGPVGQSAGSTACGCWVQVSDGWFKIPSYIYIMYSPWKWTAGNLRGVGGLYLGGTSFHSGVFLRWCICQLFGERRSTRFVVSKTGAETDRYGIVVKGYVFCMSCNILIYVSANRNTGSASNILIIVTNRDTMKYLSVYL